jgi:hypothetical protein
VLAGASSVAQAQEAGRFPFVIPWDDASKTVVDVGALNPTPAGVNGFVKARDGHFYDEKGDRVRFLGVNIVGNACFPEKADAEKVAARLHKYGVNIVRFHHMDAAWARPSIFDTASKDTQHLGKEQLDRLDYFLAQLKKNGVYANLNLHVFRKYLPDDGVADSDKLDEAGNVVTFFSPRSIELQKKYAHDLLTHLNPYTNLRYADDPAVAVVETNNENTLLGAAWGGALDNLPPGEKAELSRQWNAWLKQKYGNTTALKGAWSAEDKPLGPNLLQNAGFGRGAEHWTLELNMPPASAKMTLPEIEPPEGVKGNVVRITVAALGAQNWHIQFHQAGIDLTEGEPYTVSFWAKADRPRPMSVTTGLDRADWHNIGLNTGLQLTKEWQKFAFSFTAGRVEKDHSRLTFVLGDALGAVDMAGITLQPGVETPFPEGVSLEAGNVPFGHPVANPAGRDWVSFLMDTEQRYMQAMRDYLKNDLGVKANVTGSQASYGGMGGALRESASDFTDMHAYWQHPEFPHKPWDPADWRIPNTAMVSAANGGELPGLAYYRIAEKPFTVSEYNHPAPNDYQAECMPMLAAFAAVQDWDGFYLFDYNSDRNAWNSDKIKSFFSVDSNPAKMALLPTAARLFFRQDLALAREELRLRVARDSVAGLMTKNGPDIAPEWASAGIHWNDALTHRLSVSFVKGKKPEGEPTPAKNNDNIINPQVGKGTLDWRAMGTEKAVFTADSPYTKIMAGFLGGQSASLSGWLAEVSAMPRNFAVLTLTAVDDKPIEQSKSLLLTAVGSVENTGMQWNAARNSVGDKWGTGPTLAEGVSASVTVHTLAASATVYALDGAGRRVNKIDSRLVNGSLTFAILPADRTLWYEIETK